jgi:hypothetical protein
MAEMNFLKLTNFSTTSLNAIVTAQKVHEEDAATLLGNLATVSFATKT